MALNKLPAVVTPRPIILGVALVMAYFYFNYTKPEQVAAAPSKDGRAGV